MIFEFKHGNTVIEREYPIGRAPKSIDVAGHRYTRIPSLIAPIGPVVGAPGKTDRVFSSRSLPRNHPDAPRTDRKGRPVFTSQAEVREFCAKSRDRAEESYRYE